MENGKLRIENFRAGIVKIGLSLLTACCLLLTVNAQNDGSEQNQTGKAGTFAIVNARIVTVSGATIENGTVVIQNGKIAAVGTNVSVPSGAEKIDGKGLSVFPGMIDAGTGLGLAEIPLAVNGSVDIAEVGNMNANALALKGINPHSAHVNVTRVNGITTVLSYATGGLITGQAAVINLNGSTEDEMAVVPAFGLVINFPTVAVGGRFGRFGGGQGVDFNELVKRRDTAVDELKKIFKNAETYLKARAAYEKDKSLPYPPTDNKLESMAPYVRGEKPVMFVAERERDIKAVAKFVADLKLKGIILGGQEAWKAADDLKKNNISVVYTNIYALPVKDDDGYDSLFEAPSKMAAAGIKFCISTGNNIDDTQNYRDLPYHAGMAAAFGLSKEDALKSVTLNAADILGLGDKMGSLDVGKVANVVVTDGDMLQPTTNVKYVFINGRMLPLTSRHTDLFDSFKNRK